MGFIDYINIFSKKHDLNSAGKLRSKMNEVLCQKFTQNKYRQKKLLRIVIGLTKIFHAFMLIKCYHSTLSWDDKFNTVLLFVVTTSLVYLFEYGLTMFWWPNFYCTFTRDDDPSKNVIVCVHTPPYTPKYCLRFYLKKDPSIFQKLGKPYIDSTLYFTEYFTESGEFLERKWMSHLDGILLKISAYKTE